VKRNHKAPTAYKSWLRSSGLPEDRRPACRQAADDKKPCKTTNSWAVFCKVLLTLASRTFHLATNSLDGLKRTTKYKLATIQKVDRTTQTVKTPVIMSICKDKKVTKSPSNEILKID
jgi:hypothetical protein